MTALYAVVSDTTIRRHWEAARKVNANGETVTLDPDGPLADASWAKQRLGRATQALPNGYCGLPIQQTLPARQTLGFTLRPLWSLRQGWVFAQAGACRAGVRSSAVSGWGRAGGRASLLCRYTAGH